ncbi:stage II sporulation protein (Required for completion of engulfment) (plasmid) [Piscirickettsia salmonis]|nr:stage II sporulation protein (Required for completion of engulfment) [Piscirickettsia salmonis]
MHKCLNHAQLLPSPSSLNTCNDENYTMLTRLYSDTLTSTINTTPKTNPQFQCITVWIIT